MSITVTVELGDVTEIPSDLLLLKHAAGFHGADESVAVRLMQRKICHEDDISPGDGATALVETKGALAPQRVLFVGTPRLGKFRYNEMRQFTRRAIESIVGRRRAVRTMTTTVHGPGYGLDIEEAVQAMMLGFQEGLVSSGGGPLERIVFVERHPRRCEALTALIKDKILVAPSKVPPHAVVPPVAPPSAPLPPPKKCVFVAMPFQEEFEDVYQFGIYAAVRACGYVCEKVDESIFAGNIVDRITEGIRNAEFVIADMTLEKPNVYLEVGFAWGLNRPVILVAREGQRLHFDLSHHKCIFYRTIGKLADELEKTIHNLSGADGQHRR